MPIHLDIMDNEFIGPLIRQKVEEAKVKRLTELLLKMMRKRFGRVPAPIEKRLGSLNSEQLEAVGLNLLDAQRIEDVFGP